MHADLSNQLASIQDLLAADRVQDALAACHGLLAAGVDDYRLHVLLGSAEHRRGDLRAAREALGRATTLAPHCAQAWRALGLVLRAANQPEDAEAALRMAHAMAPDDSGAILDLAILLAAMRRHPESLELAMMLTQKRPGDITVLELVAEQLFMVHKFDDALQVGRLILQLRPDSRFATDFIANWTDPSREYFEILASDVGNAPEFSELDQSLAAFTAAETRSIFRDRPGDRACRGP